MPWFRGFIQNFFHPSNAAFLSVSLAIFLHLCNETVCKGGRGRSSSRSSSRSRNYRYHGSGLGSSGINSGSGYYQTYEDSIWPLLTLVAFLISVIGCCGYYRYKAYREEQATEESLQLLENER